MEQLSWMDILNIILGIFNIFLMWKSNVFTKENISFKLSKSNSLLFYSIYLKCDIGSVYNVEVFDNKRNTCGKFLHATNTTLDGKRVIPCNSFNVLAGVELNLIVIENENLTIKYEDAHGNIFHQTFYKDTLIHHWGISKRKWLLKKSLKNRYLNFTW